MDSSCSRDLADLFSPLRWQPDPGGGGGGGEDPGGPGAAAEEAARTPEGLAHLAPPVQISDRFLFARALYAIHSLVVRRVRRLPDALRLGLELALLLAAFAQLAALVTLHSLLMPAPGATHTLGALAPSLASALKAPGLSVQLLRIDISAPELGGRCPAGSEGAAPPGAWPWQAAFCAGAYPPRVSCELAAERAFLELPPPVRERAYRRGTLSRTALSLEVQANGSLPSAAYAVPGLAFSALSRQLLAALVWGPLHAEVRERELASAAAEAEAASASVLQRNRTAANRTGPASAASPAGAAAEGPQGLPGSAPAAAAEPEADAQGRRPSPPQASEQGRGEGSHDLFVMAGVVAHYLAGRGPGSSALMYVSCQGAAPVSIEPLRRAAEILKRPAEWWLFKTVWALGAGMIPLLAAVLTSFAVRAALFSLFRLGLAASGELGYAQPRALGTLELLEDAVLLASPGALAWSYCRMAGDRSPDVAFLLACQAVGEVMALCVLRTEESRYIFPRAVLPVYLADVYYASFHPFGLTWLAHGALCCFQGFVLVALCNHFEAVARLPPVCSEQLTVEVKLRARRASEPHIPPTVEPSIQRLLIEQGLLLLGDDPSHESAVVMSALMSRSAQAAGYPAAPPALADQASTGVAPEDEMRLGGGPLNKMLVAHARAGNGRCLALLRHIAGRLERQLRVDRREVLQWLLTQSDEDTGRVLQGLAQVRPHLLQQAAAAAAHEAAMAASADGDSYDEDEDEDEYGPWEEMPVAPE